MSTQVELRRGTSAQHLVFTGVEAEPTYDSTEKTIVIHDGATAGGFPLATRLWVTDQMVETLPDGSLTPEKLVDAPVNTVLGNILDPDGPPAWLTSAEQRQASGHTTIGSGVATADDTAEALAAIGASALLLTLWSYAR